MSLSAYDIAEISLKANPLFAPKHQKAKELESKGWRVWYATMFGQAFIDALDGENEHHHSEALEWHWESRQAFLHDRRPEYFAYFPIWARGNMKTTLGRALTVCDAAISTSAGIGGYALVPAGTKAKGRGTAISIEQMLHSPKLKEYYPALSKVKRNPQGMSKGWTADFLYTEAGYVFHFIGLDEGVAGTNILDIRPTLISPDDIDDREDSPVISESRFHTFTHAVLPTRQQNTLVYFAQNLISRFSCMYRIHNQQVRVLTNRKPTQPIPAVRNLVTEQKTVGGIVKDIVVSGKPTWKIWTLERVQDEIDTYGLDAFLRECQHEVEQDRKGLVLQAWNDSVHVISRSEFAKIYGTREIPQRWSKYVFNDWARTKTQYHANVAGTVTVSSQNSQLPGCVFVFNPLSFNAGTAPEDVAEKVLTGITPTVKVSGRDFTWKELIKTTLQKSNLESIVSATDLIERRRSLLARVMPALVSPILKAQNYAIFRASHERTDVLKVYRTIFGLPFRGTNPGADGGVDTLNLLMRVDYSEPHPFRKDEKGHANFFLVVEDGENGLPSPYRAAMKPDELHGEDLFRYQMANWRYRDPYLTVKGEHEGELLKMSDDFGNGLMMLFYDNVVSAAPLSYKERLETVIPDKYQYEKLLAESPHEKGLTQEQEMAFQFQLARAKQKVKPTVRQWDAFGNEVGKEYDEEE